MSFCMLSISISELPVVLPLLSCPPPFYSEDITCMYACIDSIITKMKHSLIELYTCQWVLLLHILYQKFLQWDLWHWFLSCFLLVSSIVLGVLPMTHLQTMIIYNATSMKDVHNLLPWSQSCSIYLTHDYEVEEFLVFVLVVTNHRRYVNDHNNYCKVTYWQIVC